MSIYDDVTAVRMALRWTGTLPEVAQKSLALWPKVFLDPDSFESFKIELDADSHRVSYQFVFKKGVKPDLEGLDRIRQSVEFLLGPDWTVQFKSRGKAIYTPWTLPPIPVRSLP